MAGDYLISAGCVNALFSNALKGNLMLVLNRKKDQVIVIDGEIRITIVAIKGNTVKVGVEAPKETRVVREELKGKK